MPGLRFPGGRILRFSKCDPWKLGLSFLVGMMCLYRRKTNNTCVWVFAVHRVAWDL